LKDEEKREREQKMKIGNYKNDIETAKRIMGNLKREKKKNMEQYEKLEQNLTKFEIEEEEQILRLMDGQGFSDDSDNDIRSQQKKAIKIDDNNIFDLGGPRMARQDDDDDDVEKKLREIEDKINRQGYHLDAEADKNDMFFPTEIETNYQKVKPEEEVLDIGSSKPGKT